MKNRLNLSCALFFLLMMGLNAAPINFKTAKETARKFYGVQMSVASVKSMPEFSCVFPKDQKSTAPYYIFNAGEDQGFIIVAGDDNATRSVLAYSDKGRFEVENMPENVKAWLGFYEESIKRAAKSDIKGNFSSDFSKAEVVKGPLLENISYNQGVPYNDLCPIDPTTNRRSYSGCVATAIASVARYYQYPKTGKGSITYSWKGQELSMDFSQNTYDWDNMLEAYNGPVSTYTQEQRTAVATLMRDCGYAVRMNYGSDASGAVRDNTVVGVVDYLGFDSVLNYRERDSYDNDDQWKALLKSNLDNEQPVYYSGHGDGGGHAFVCDGYNDADFFHINWGWGSYCDGYFLVEYLDPGSTEGIGAGSGGGYASYQGILHNMVPPGHSRVADDYLLMSTSSIEPVQIEDSIYPIHENPITVPLRGFQNYSMSRFEGTVALALFKDGEFVKILSDEESVSMDRRASVSVSFSLEASLDDVETGEYEIWTVSKPKSDTTWSKVYAEKSNRYTNDSYIPVSVGNGSYRILKTTAVVSIQMDCQMSRNIDMYIYSKKGAYLGSSRFLSIDILKKTFIYGIYEFRFWTRGYDTTYLNVNITKDTSLLVPLQERLLPPYIRGVRVGVGEATLLWRKEASDGETAYPTGYIVYLDSVEVARVGTSTLEYKYTDLPVGSYQAGLRSAYLTGESPMKTYNFKITSSNVANEKEWKGVCRLTPNPSPNGNFVLEVEQNCHLQVCDLAGKVLFNQKLSSGSNQVDMTGYPAGIYVFRLNAKNGQSTSLKAVLKK